MDEDRRDTAPGRRWQDAATRELVRKVLRDEGYVTMSAGDNRYVRRTDSAAGRDWTLRIIGLVLVAGQLITTILVATGGNP